VTVENVCRTCPDCGDLYRVRHEREAERCWWCAGLSLAEHLELIGDPVVAHRYNARPAPARQANDKPAYLAQIERLIGQR
jgi:hypothetical protein